MPPVYDWWLSRAFDVDNNGNNLTADTRLTFNAVNANDAFLSTGPNSTIHIVWSDVRDGGNDEIYYKGSILQPKLKILAVPLNWQDTQIVFDNAVDTQIGFFINDTLLNGCKEKVVITKLNISTQSLNNFTCNFDGCGVDQITPFIEGLSIDPGYYDHIIGFVQNSPCLPISGCSDGFKTAWVETSGDASIAAHEIGHLYGLEDEYCSNLAGSSDCRCNDGGQVNQSCYSQQGIKQI